MNFCNQVDEEKKKMTKKFLFLFLKYKFIKIHQSTVT